MGTVVRLDIANRTGVVEQAPHDEPIQDESIPEGLEGASPEEVRLAKRTLADIQFLQADAKNMQFLRDAYSVGDKATNYIFNLRGFEKKDEHIELRRQGFAEYPLEQLCTILMGASRHQWSQYPHTFGAAILEIEMRVAYVRMCIPEMELPDFKWRDQ